MGLCFPETYGEVMRALSIPDLPAPIQSIYRDDPVFRDWVDVTDRTMRAEKVSSWTTWSEDETEAYRQEDTVRFSQLRGYTAGEIAEFQRYLQLTNEVAGRYEGMDFCAEVVMELKKATATEQLWEIDAELERISRRGRGT